MHTLGGLLDLPRPATDAGAGQPAAATASGDSEPPLRHTCEASALEPARLLARGKLRPGPTKQSQ